MGVVIPCYQSARFLREAVSAVLGQTLPPKQVVIVDDGSTDDPRSAIADLLETEPRLQLLHQSNRGVVHARDFGVKQISDADYLLFLDADDVPETSMLRRLADTLEQAPSAVMAWSLPAFIDERGRSIPDEPTAPRFRARCPFRAEEIPLSEQRTTFASIFALAGIMPSHSLIRASAFIAAGGWDVEFGQGYDDTDLTLRLALQGEILLVPERLARRRTHHGQSTAAAAEHYSQQEQRLRAKWRDLSELDTRQRRTVLAGWRLYERQLALTQAARIASVQYNRGEYWRATSALLGGVKRYARSCLLHHPRSRRA